MRERQYIQCLHYGQILDLKRDFSDLQKNDGAEEKSFGKLKDEEFQLFEPINQSIPIVLAITSQKRDELLNHKGPIRLMYNNKLIALLYDTEIYAHRKEERIHRQFGYSDNRHPAIKMIQKQGDWLIGGDLEVN